MKLFYPLIFLFISFSIFAKAQQELPMPKVPVMRQLFHLKIDEAQSEIIKLKTISDTLFFASTDSSENIEINTLLKVGINNLQVNIEIDSTYTQSDKFIWLRAIENLLTDFKNYYNLKSIPSNQLGSLIIAFRQCITLQRNQQSIAPIIANNTLEVSSILLGNNVFKDNIEAKLCKDLVVLKLCKRAPSNSLKILTNYTDVYFVDSIIKTIAYTKPEELYNYAATPNKLGRKIQSINDPLIKTIGLLAYMNTGRMYFPFLDKLYKNELSIDSISKLINNDEAYYKLLVATQIDYAKKLQNGDTPFVYKVLTEKLKAKAIEVFIDEINALHNEKLDAVRFKKIDNLNPQELYYLCVLGEEEIYTSSYLGVYKRIFQRMTVPKSDSLFHLVYFDYYKKFIKLAAAYNQLDDFLKKMDKATADKTMRNFVTNLNSKKTLEDAVDVADSYVSITDTSLQKLMLRQIQFNQQESKLSNDESAKTIYRILKTIFLSIDSTNKIDLNKELGINPVFVMPTKLLKDSSDQIIVQQFFYGDKDGMNVFNNFLSKFQNPNWKIIQKPFWVEVKSTKGIKISIYSNRPLDETKDLDAQAQLNLINYLDSLHLEPTFVIHRGHSYYVKSTISQLAPSAKVVLLGSCGGYQSLNKILHIAPEAQIISSKQTGTGLINQTLINAMMENLRQGKDLNWPKLWQTLSNQFKATKSKDQFDDYVPPHKNLGAIFIIAYEKAVE